MKPKSIYKQIIRISEFSIKISRIKSVGRCRKLQNIIVRNLKRSKYMQGNDVYDLENSVLFKH